MRKLILPLAAVAALALPAGAFAHGHGYGHGPQGNNGRHNGEFAHFAVKTHDDNGNDDNGTAPSAPPTAVKLSGTGTSFGVDAASVTGTTFTAALTTTWASATTKTFGTATLKCAPATASITISSPATPAATFTGKTCSWTVGTTTKYGFAGSSTAGARAFLTENGTTVTGAVLTGGGKGLHLGLVALHIKGNCPNM
jgi:hypothetical protein